MPTSYPGAIDTFSNPASGTALNDPAIPHAAQHANANDAIEAIETLLGANGANYVSVAGAQTITGAKTYTAAESKVGEGAAGAVGTFVHMGSFGLADTALVMARGSAADVNLRLRSKGVGSVALQGGANLTGLTVADNGAASLLGFYLTSPIAKPAVTGARGGNAALASLLTQLAALGLLTDSTTA